MESPQESHYLPLQHGWHGCLGCLGCLGWLGCLGCLGWLGCLGCPARLSAFFVLFLLLSIIIDSLVDMESPHRGPVPPCPTWHTRTGHDPPRTTRSAHPCTPTWRTRSTGTAPPRPPCHIYKEGENNVRILRAKNRNTLYCSPIRDLFHKCARIAVYFSPSNNRLYISTLSRFRLYYGNSVRGIRPS